MEDLALDNGAGIDAAGIADLTSQILRIVDKEHQHQVTTIDEDEKIESFALGATKGGSPGKP